MQIVEKQFESISHNEIKQLQSWGQLLWLSYLIYKRQKVQQLSLVCSGKWENIFFNAKKVADNIIFHAAMAANELIFNFYACLNRKFVHNQKKNKTDIFRGVGKLQCIYYEWTNRESISVRWAKFNLEDWGRPQKLFILFTELYANIHATFTYIFAYEFVVGAKSLGKFPWDPTNYIYFPLKEGKIF